jgi:hypothetical protein
MQMITDQSSTSFAEMLCQVVECLNRKQCDLLKGTMRLHVLMVE